MKRNGINVYHRKDNRWEGRYRFVGDDGKRCYRSVYGKSRSETVQKLIKLKSSGCSPNKKCNLTFEKLFFLWIENIKSKLKQSTYANYLYIFEKHILIFLGDVKYKDLTADKLNYFINTKLNSGGKNNSSLSPKYVSGMLAVIKSICKFASKNYNYHNPALEITCPKILKKQHRLMYKHEHNKLATLLFSTVCATNAGIILALFCGMRIGEICALSWYDVDLGAGTIRVSKTLQRIRCAKNIDGCKSFSEIVISSPKTSASIRDIPLPRFILEYLIQLKTFIATDNGFILSSTEKYVEPRLLQYRFIKFLNKANLPSINFHTLRHMFATTAIAHGVDIKTLSEILGHSSVAVTMNIYVHTSAERKRECMNKMKLIN